MKNNRNTIIVAGHLAVIGLCFGAASCNRKNESNSMTHEKPSLQALANIKLGIYRHYKGNLFKVLGVARHQTWQGLAACSPMPHRASHAARPGGR